jgi:hypothetical protein
MASRTLLFLRRLRTTPPRLILESKNDLAEDGAVARGRCSIGPLGQRLRFAIKRRAERAVGRAKIHDVEEVNRPADQGQAVLARYGGVQFGLRLAAAQSPAVYAAVPASESWCAFRAFDPGTNSNHLADAQVDHKICRA